MKQFPDGFFDLAVVDPPYGGGACSQSGNVERERERERESCTEARRILNSAAGHGSEGGLTATISASRTGGGWDAKRRKRQRGRTFGIGMSRPPKEYFNELARVSKNQIIWGGNYFDLPPTRCFLIWRKLQIPLEGFSMSAVEYAWTSFNDNAAMWEGYSNAQTGAERRIHPTQKPVALYTWIFKQFAKPGYKILDTHLGSGSSRIAAYDAGLDFWGYELDKVYFDLMQARFEKHAAQMNLFLDT
jgi:site-specific DNA-methyltransferase (adenine-specific)